MDRLRSKRSYHYDHDSDSPPRAKHRRHPLPPPPPPPPPHRRRPRLSPSPPPPTSAAAPSPAGATTVFRVLCPESCAAAVLGKSGVFIKAVRQDTGAWIDVHDPCPGDGERVVETSDTRRREPDGAPPRFSPAEDAMARIHARIVDVALEEDAADGPEYGGGGGGGGGWWRDRGRMVSRLVVPRAHVGCLLGKGGKIIEHMRNETRTHIRILPRDQYTPRCVSAAEEVVQVVGDGNAVKKAVAIILSRLKESLHRDRGPFRGRLQSPEHYLPPNDDFVNDTHHRLPLEGSDFGSLSSVGLNRDIVFRILCPNEKVESVMGVPDGIIELLQTVVGVHVRATDPVPGSDERIIIVTSDEGPDDDLFPAQEALLHIQTRIVDLGPDKDNIITTRLLIKASEIGCLEGRDGLLADIRKTTNANVQILPKEDHPLCAAEVDELVQIVGEIRAARKALLQLTEKLRSFLYCDIAMPKDLLSSSIALGNGGSLSGLEPASPIRSSSLEGYEGNNLPASVHQNLQSATTTWQSKDTGGSTGGSLEQQQSRVTDEERKSGPKRFLGPLVTKSTLEVIIPEHAIPSLMKGSGSKLVQISEMSGATVTLLEDRPELTEKVVQISGSPEQAERAQSLLQGFILSTL